MTLSGQVETMRDSYAGLFSGMGLAVILVYLFLVINFQSWIDPLIVLMAVPFALGGVLWILFLSQTPMSVPAVSLPERFFRLVSIVRSALSCDEARLVVTKVFSSVTGPVKSRVTGSQIPVSRSRTAASQSQPTVDRNVAPSSALSPPFFPMPSATVCSCGMPGCGCG